MVHKKKNVLHAILLAYLVMKSYTCTDCIKNKAMLAYTVANNCNEIVKKNTKFTVTHHKRCMMSQS